MSTIGMNSQCASDCVPVLVPVVVVVPVAVPVPVPEASPESGGGPFGGRWAQCIKSPGKYMLESVCWLGDSLRFLYGWTVGFAIDYVKHLWEHGGALDSDAGGAGQIGRNGEDDRGRVRSEKERSRSGLELAGQRHSDENGLRDWQSTLRKRRKEDLRLRESEMNALLFREGEAARRQALLNGEKLIERMEQVRVHSD